MRIAKTLALCLITALPSIVFAETQNDEGHDDSLKGLITLESIKNNEAIGGGGDALHIREGALREAAATVGLQGGIKYRYSQINQEINRMADQLDFIYDFKPLLIKEKMMPPIVAESSGSYGLHQDGSASSSLTTFEIIQEAKLVAMQPQWRDYLIQDYQANTDINPALRPKDDTEIELWKTGVKAGWEEGIRIADRMADENINHLTRDYRGSIRFHRLAQQGILTMPTLAIGDLGIHVNGKKLDVNHRIFRISEPTQYKENPKDWKIISGKQIEQEN